MPHNRRPYSSWINVGLHSGFLRWRSMMKQPPNVLTADFGDVCLQVSFIDNLSEIFLQTITTLATSQNWKRRRCFQKLKAVLRCQSVDVCVSFSKFIPMAACIPAYDLLLGNYHGRLGDFNVGWLCTSVGLLYRVGKNWRSTGISFVIPCRKLCYLTDSTEGRNALNRT